MIPGLPDSIPADPGYANGIGEGWWPLVEQLHKHLLQLDKHYTIQQVKEKYGTLRYYYEPSVNSHQAFAMEKLVRFAEAISAQTCETCGAPGEIRDACAWVVTVCDACYGA